MFSLISLFTKKSIFSCFFFPVCQFQDLTNNYFSNSDFIFLLLHLYPIL